ncbi:MAG: TetR/AcrR family transcriptional regulator [Planctomycetes bacterium]|nr:TetR/AcrR family transcriptional regulator [Planctomycetota bacterium]
MGRPKANTITTATTERILAAAEREFGRRGLDAARLADIAATAGITRPSLLYHFASKRALYAAVVHRAFDRLREALVPAVTRTGPFLVRLDQLVSAYHAFLDERPWVASVLLRELLDGHGPGKSILLTEVAPLLDWVEAFVRKAGRGRVRPRLPARGAILQLVAAALVRTVAGSLREPLWGPTDDAAPLARLLFLRE